MPKSRMNVRKEELPQGGLQLQVRGNVVTATAVFANIRRLKEWDADTAYRALVGLHQAIRTYFGREIGNRLSVLSSLTGAIIIVPDASNLFIHQHLQRLGVLWSELGIPVAAGVARGELEVLADVDGVLNAIGQPLNIA